LSGISHIYTYIYGRESRKNPMKRTKKNNPDMTCREQYTNKEKKENNKGSATNDTSH
jgi:hypothetical protein